MTTFSRLNEFNTTLVKLAAQSNYLQFPNTYKLGRINISFSNMENLIKENPIKLEELSTRQFKCLGFKWYNGLMIIPLQFIKLIPSNLEVYEKYTLDPVKYELIENNLKYGVIPNKINYLTNDLSDGFWYYIKYGKYPDEKI